MVHAFSTPWLLEEHTKERTGRPPPLPIKRHHSHTMQKSARKAKLVMEGAVGSLTQMHTNGQMPCSRHHSHTEHVSAHKAGARIQDLIIGYQAQTLLHIPLHRSNAGGITATTHVSARKAELVTGGAVGSLGLAVGQFASGT